MSIRNLAWAVAAALLGSTPAGAAAIPCTHADLVAAVSAASGAGGGVITFLCRDATIPMTTGLGTLASGVVVDGEDRNIVLDYTPIAGCTQTNSAAPIATLQGRGNVIRNLTFRNFLESIRLNGPGNLVEANTFLGMPTCSDDAVSLPAGPAAIDNVIRANTFQDYPDKAIQMSFGGGTIEGNTFIDTLQPIRGPYDNSAGAPFVIRNNVFRTSGERSRCNGVLIDGAYEIVFEGNTVECKRGIRFGGTTEVTITDNTIDGNGSVGVLIYGNAVASLARNTIIGNGATPGIQPAGGVVLWEDVPGRRPQADLGGGSVVLAGAPVTSAGGNTIRGNNLRDVRNLRTDAYVLKAEGNCWDGADAGAILGDVEGAVDFEPFAAACGAPPAEGPIVVPLSPAEGDTCVAPGALVSVLVQDSREAVDAASIAVLVNGAPVAPSVSGAGSALAVAFLLPPVPDAAGAVTVQVTASDTAAPPNTTIFSYGFTLEPAPPTGVTVE